MILTMVAMLSMTMAFAENETAASVNNVEAYDMSVNMNKLSDALALTADQVEAVAEIHHTFAAEMMFAAQYNNDVRKTRVNDAIEKDDPLRSVPRVLFYHLLQNRVGSWL